MSHTRCSGTPQAHHLLAATPPTAATPAPLNGCMVLLDLVLHSFAFVRQVILFGTPSPPLL